MEDQKRMCEVAVRIGNHSINVENDGRSRIWLQNTSGEGAEIAVERMDAYLAEILKREL